MEQTVVTASTARKLGSSHSRRLRREGRLPGVLYGMGKDPVNVHVSYIELRDALKTDAGLNTVFRLDVDGQQDLVLVKDVQRHPIRPEVLHVDFLRIDENQTITVDVPIHLEGEATEVEEAGLVVDQILFSLAVECSPTSIPDSIVVDISVLTADNNITVGDLNLPRGVQAVLEDEAPVVSTAIPRAVIEEDEEAAEDADGEVAEGEEGAEGEDAADAESGDGDAEASGDDG